jgi:Dyp-type peroxidase family
VKREVAEILVALGEAKPRLPRDVLIPSTGNTQAGDIPPGEPDEPIYPRSVRDDIQGNVVPGFNKDHQHFLFLRIGDVRRARRWLRDLAPRLATMDDVLAFVRAHRSLRMRLGEREPDLNSAWVNVAFSYAGLARLASRRDADALGDQSFRQGLAERSTYIGDPSSPSQAGHRSKWVVGAPDNEADVLVIVAADVVADLDSLVERTIGDCEAAGLSLLFQQRGDTMPGDLRGHEHFGFKDGISQPGIRGKVSSAAGDFITPRYLAPDDPHARLYGKPGQPLVWPGQFLLGEPRQDTQDPFKPAAGAANFPAWARGGSYLVFRRLQQDVDAFWTFAVDTAASLGISPVRFASLLVGRWPSGAPLMRSPTRDDTALAGDEWANNHFLFEDDTRPARLRPVPGYEGDDHQQARGDLLGTVCPHFAHIRKVNPRDGGTDLGTPADTLMRLMLRRGIPFGQPLVGVRNPSRALQREERGLLFVSYAATIEDQFEMISRRWANSPVQPKMAGHDPVMGQADRNGDRTRFIDFPVPRSTKRRRVEIAREWIVPTGGGYFFAPPVSAVAQVLGR